MSYHCAPASRRHIVTNIADDAVTVHADGLVATGASTSVDSSSPASGINAVVSSIVQAELGERVTKLEKVLKAEVEARILGENQLGEELKRGFQAESQHRDDQFRYSENNIQTALAKLSEQIASAVTVANTAATAVDAQAVKLGQVDAIGATLLDMQSLLSDVQSQSAQAATKTVRQTACGVLNRRAGY